MNRPLAEQRLDYYGIALSAGCAVHCALTPALVAVVPALGISSGLWSNPLVHQAAALVCAGVVVRAIGPAWRRHRDPAVGSLAAGGIGLLLLAGFVLPDPCCQSPVTFGWVGQPLMTVESARDWFGASSAHHLLRLQPFLTPIGGLLLVAAHAANLDLIRRRHRLARQCSGGQLPAAGRV